MGSFERIQHVARKVFAASQKQPVVVVVSAMQGETIDYFIWQKV